eukprot:GEMP01019798.1.p1 GENE.GEMP01019798.1~~GEMP01019798.1.p1  ORF type:complete len:506 (+),score=89.70 GEMP01019798.1:136-1653(+)
MYTIWTTPTPNNSPGPRAAHSCDTYNTKLYIFGGWNGKNALNDLWAFDVSTNTWAEVEVDAGSMAAPSPRNNHATAVSDTQLILHGGHDGNTWLSCMHLFDFQEQRWRPCNPSGTQPAARACHTLTKLSCRLFMFGGYDGLKCFNDVDVLDLQTMTWTRLVVSGEYPQARNAHTMTVVGDFMFLCGGHSGSMHLTDLHVFDTTRRTWSQPTFSGVPPPGLRGHSATAMGSKIFIFGGYDGKGRSNEISILDVQGTRWLRPTSDAHFLVPPGRQRHSASLVPPKKIYIFGGFDGNQWLDDIHVLDVGRMEENDLQAVSVHALILNLQKLLDNPEFADVCFDIEGHKLWAHKALLLPQCDELRRIIQDTEGEILIEGWSFAAFSAVIRWMYTGRIEGVETDCDSAIEILGLASHFALTLLKQLCENMLVNGVNASNVISILKAADKYDAVSLKKHALAYLLKYFDQVASTPALNALEDSPGLLLEVTRASAARYTRSPTPLCGSGSS